MFKFLLTAFALTPFLCLSQVRITGQVLNLTTTKPVPFASVFLSNSTTGGETADDGTFTLYNVKPGKYDLVVSILGYETNTQTVLVGDGDIHLPPVYLISTAIPLNSVKIKPDDKWYRLYLQFKDEFLGTSDFAKKCRILDPDSLDLDYDPKTRLLTAKSRGFLVIENKALGYRVKYLLQNFVLDHEQKSMLYKGYTIFEDLAGTAADTLTWKKNRRSCYLGSSMHFFRSVKAGRVEAQGFEVYKLSKSRNPTKFASNYLKTGYADKYVFTDSLLERKDYFMETDQNGIFALINPYSYIIYKNALDYGRAPIYKEFDMPNWQSTEVILKQPYALFDSNGVLTDPLSLSYEGYWATDRVAELLPVDYQP